MMKNFNNTSHSPKKCYQNYESDTEEVVLLISSILYIIIYKHTRIKIKKSTFLIYYSPVFIQSLEKSRIV